MSHLKDDDVIGRDVNFDYWAENPEDEPLPWTRWIMGMILVILLVAMFSCPAAAQERQPSLKIPSAIFLTSAAADWTTTYRVGAVGGVEVNPLYSWAEPNQKLIVMTGVASDVAGLWMWNRFVGRKHPKIARAGLIGMSGFRFYLAVHNERLRRRLR